MAEGNHRSPGLLGLTQRLVSTGLGALQNRGELLTVEWQEERARLTQVLLAAVSFAFLAILGVVLFTTTIVLLFPVEQRVYVMAGFTVLYLIGAVVAWLVLRSLLRRAPFAESLDQMQKDRVWLETFQ
jgi:uncharacterized membrane protein YqjE